MFKKIIGILCILCLLNCEQQPKQTVETSQQTNNRSKDHFTVDETGFESFDASDYLSGQLLAGKSSVFQKENIRTLLVLGHDFYKINSQGLITAKYDISNNYSEFTYTKDGLLQSIAYKQHSPELTYYTKKLHYRKDGTLLKSEITRYDQQTKQTTKETITEAKALQESLDYFKVPTEYAPFQINRQKRILLTYRNDLLFCCGVTMPGKNSLQYHYSDNQLIDSVVINSLESDKKLTFTYEYSPVKKSSSSQ